MGGSPESIRGVLLHRCVLHPGGKWKEAWGASRDALTADRGGETVWEYETGWMAQRLLDALDADIEFAWALADSGGPHWVEVVGAYQALGSKSHSVKQSFVADAVAVASVLARRAQRATEPPDDIDARGRRHLVYPDNPDRGMAWLSIRTEVENPLAQLGKGEDWGRIDLLVDRGRRNPPLIIDLHFGRDSPAVKLAKTISKHGAPFAEMLGRKVEVQALCMRPGGQPEWSERTTCQPMGV